LNEEASWIERSQKGDARAYESLVRQYEQVAFRTAWLITRDPHAAAEVAQDAFLRAFRSLGSFRRGLPFRPWLLRIVTNQALNYLKATQRQDRVTAEYAQVLTMNEPDPSPEQQLSQREENERLVQAVNRLSPDERTLIALRYFLELSEKEVAETLAIPLGTCKSRLHRTLERLREIIGSDFPDLTELRS
jgi:RNA polymerase sigma-70 factor (ECF subfamily)